VGGSKILMLDEITAALDPKTAANVMRIAADVIREEGRTTLMITHNMADAIHYGTRTILLTNGQIGKCYNKDEKAQLTPALLINEFSMF
jgi:putative ABC transport system ATP-binding protein